MTTGEGIFYSIIAVFCGLPAGAVLAGVVIAWMMSLTDRLKGENK